MPSRIRECRRCHSLLPIGQMARKIGQWYCKDCPPLEARDMQEAMLDVSPPPLTKEDDTIEFETPRRGYTVTSSARPYV